MKIFPKDYIDYLLSLVKYENFLDYTLFQGESENGEDFDRYIDDYFLLRQAVVDKNFEDGEKLYEKLMDQDIYHPFTEAEWACILMEKGDLYSARQILDRLWQGISGQFIHCQLLCPGIDPGSGYGQG